MQEQGDQLLQPVNTPLIKDGCCIMTSLQSKPLLLFTGNTTLAHWWLSSGGAEASGYLSMSCGRSVRQLLLRSRRSRPLILRAQIGIDTNLFSAMSRWTSCLRLLSCWWRSNFQYWQFLRDFQLLNLNKIWRNSVRYFLYHSKRSHEWPWGHQQVCLTSNGSSHRWFPVSSSLCRSSQFPSSGGTLHRRL